MKFVPLEDEIKSSFRNEQHKLVLNVFFTYYRLLDNVKDRFKDHDITLQQYNVLRILKGQKGNPASIQLVKGRVMDKNSDMSRIIDRLCQKKFISRTESLTDKRKKDILITQAGLDKIDSIEDMVNGIEKLFDHFDEDEIHQLNTLLDKSRSQLKHD